MFFYLYLVKNEETTVDCYSLVSADVCNKVFKRVTVWNVFSR
jgi:hypothetical protein